MKYTILRTDQFADQLNSIILYIAQDSGDVDLALQRLTIIEQAVLRLQEFPESGALPRYSLLKKQGYRVLIIEKYLVFYTVDVDGQTAMLHAIVDSRRAYENLM